MLYSSLPHRLSRRLVRRPFAADSAGAALVVNVDERVPILAARTNHDTKASSITNRISALAMAVPVPSQLTVYVPAVIDDVSMSA